MIEKKKKICTECGNERYIFSKGRCKWCANKEYMETAKANRIAKVVSSVSNGTNGNGRSNGRKKISKPKKPKVTAKRKRQTITSLKKKVWRIFSKYIRLRDSDNDGYCKCFTCGKRGYWIKDGMEAGHFVSRRYNNTLYDERNVHSQCTRCNSYLAGRQYEYGRKLDVIYGEDTADNLVVMSKQVKKFTLDELNGLYRKYSDLVHKLLLSKGLKK